jgi:hypothetical protein|nr:MAG TPA: hypothetical protein [Caudoviricetes sp.]
MNMSKKAMYDLRDMLCKELDEISRKGELGAGDLEIAHKLTDTIKNIDKIEMMEDDGYSRDGDYSSDGDYSRGGDWQADMRGTYGRGSSYARRGTHYVRGHYSRADSMEHLREQINDMMRETDDDRVKEALRRAASLMEE